MIKGLAADIIVSIYLLVTLFFRFQAEKGLADHPIFSILGGVVLLGVLWALIKTNILAPNYFGLMGKQSNKE